MKKRKNFGFTLLELLVVVLIVAVLTVVALPQYKRTVYKSRYSTLKSLAKSIYDAQEVYYLANDVYASNLANLDVSAENLEKIKVDLGESAEYEFVRTSMGDEKNRYTMYQRHSENFADNIYCEALTQDDVAKSVCLSEGGIEQGVYGEYTLYLLAGSSSGTIPVAGRRFVSVTRDGWRNPYSYVPYDVFTFSDNSKVYIRPHGYDVYLYEVDPEGNEEAIIYYRDDVCPPGSVCGDDHHTMSDFCNLYGDLPLDLARYNMNTDFWSQVCK